MQHAPAEMDLRSIPSSDENFLKTLEDAGMPRDDLGTSHGEYFALLDTQGQALGYCGFEKLDGGLVLIRSCVVPREHRGKGMGHAMMRALLDRLDTEQRRDLYLFTLDAGLFFAKFGFEVRVRNTAPMAVRATSQFNMGCCEDAPFMHRAI